MAQFIRSFDDSSGRRWSVTPFTIGRVRALRESLDIDLLDHRLHWRTRVLVDPTLLLALVMACVTPSDGQPPTYDDWNGEDIDSALSQVMEALADFFPSGQRQVLQLAWKEITRTAAALTEEQFHQIASTSTCGTSSTTPPAGSGSTPSP
jgi:hypothetical protein